VFAKAEPTPRAVIRPFGLVLLTVNALVLVELQLEPLVTS
jgi:hypothetical protein